MLDYKKLRREKSILHQHGHQTSLIWEWIVNEFVHLINSQRKEQDIKIGNRRDLFISGLSERQQMAILNEYSYICEECQLNKIVINKSFVKYRIKLILPDAALSIQEVNDYKGVLEWKDIGERLVPISINLKEKDNIYYEKVKL